MQLFQLDPVGEVAPKINNLRIFGKKSMSAKFKASVMPSGEADSLLVFDAPSISSFMLFNFFSKNYVPILNENVLLHLSFHYHIFLIKP